MKRKTTFLTKAAMLLIVALFSLTGVRAETLTVHNGTTTNNIVPVYGNWVDNYSKSQFIIASSDLDEMFAGSIITGMTFYASQSSSSWGNAKFDVYLSEVSETTISALKGWNTLTKVYSGSLSISGSQMTITFNTPYKYLGGNLLVGINETTTGGYSQSSWYGETVTGASVGGYGNNISQRNFIPKTTFTYFPPATNVTVSNITPTTADVTWDGNDDARGYVLEYAVGEYSGDATLSYDNGIRVNAVGSRTTSTWTWGVMYPANQVTYSQLTKVSIFETAAYNTRDITINIYSGGDTAPGTLLHTETVATEHADAFHEVTFATPIAITPGENLWITLTETGTYVIPVCTSSETNNQWYEEDDGSWASISAQGGNFANYGWMIRAEINDLNLSTDWTTVENATSPHTLTGLNPDTHYLVRVKALYGNGVESGWSGISGFTTLISNPTPIDVEVDPSYTTADISWTGYATSYEVKYRKVSFFDDFENGLNRWTIYTEGEHPDGDAGWVEVGGMAASYSWHRTGGPDEGETLNANNWLITPAVELGGTLKFWAYSSYGDEYEVLLSTTGNAIGDFTTELKSMGPASNSGADVTIDLSAYDGQTGYIAIHHVYNSGYYLDIDNFEISRGEWKTATTETTSIELTDLEPDTEYEFIITGKKSGSDDASTDCATFTTLDGALVKIAWFGYSSLYYGEKNLKLPAGVTAQTFKKGEFRMEESHYYANEDVIPAGTAVIVKGAEGTYVFPATDESGYVDNDNELKGFDKPTQTEPGTDDYYYYVLSVKKGSTADNGGASTAGFYWNNSTGGPFKSAAHKAYLPIKKSSDVKSFYVFGEDDPTGISNVDANVDANVAIYNLAGQRIQKMQKGVNIVNGKKILK